MEYIVLIIAVFGCVYCPFWIKNAAGDKVGNYEFIKKALGYE